MNNVDGERARYEALIDEYGGYVHAIVSRIASGRATREDVEDCAAEALLSLWRARDRFDPHKGDQRHYVAAVARNQAIDMLRRASRGGAWLPLNEDILILDANDPAKIHDDVQLAALLAEAVDALEPPDPEIFRRRYYWGESLRAIADALGLSERAVEGRLYRGRKQLKEHLEGRL